MIPTEKQTVPSTSNIDAKKADIERKKKESIDSIKEGYNGGKIWIYTSEFSGEFPSTNQVSQDDYTKEQLISEIEKTYDAELAALGTNVVPANAESSDDVESPAVEAGKKEREVTVIDDSLRYRVSDFKADLTKVNTPAELKALLGELSIKNAEQLISFEDLQQMAAMAKTKAEELNTPENVKLAPESLAVGTQLVAKNTIFTQAGKEDNVFAETDDTVIVKSVDKAKKTVTISPLNSDSKITLSFNELGKSFTLKDVVMDAKESTDQKVTPEDQNKINESTDLADNFVQNKTGRLDEIEGQASVKSLEELDEELLEDIEC